MNMGHSASSTATRAGPRIAKIVARWHFVICVRTVTATTAKSLNHVLIAIRYFARIVTYDDFINNKGWIGSRENGKLRLEGKDYIVNDGDVLNFRFNT